MIKFIIYNLILLDNIDNYFLKIDFQGNAKLQNRNMTMFL